MKPVFLAMMLACGAAPAMAAEPASPAAADQAAPAKAPIDLARLALAKVTVDSIWPIGTYERLMKDMMGTIQDSVMGRMLDSTAAELGIEVEDDDGKTLRERIAQKDPHFEERMRITSEVMGEEMVHVFAKLEPKLREGLANAYARRFTVTELTEINRFFASPAGASYARQSMELMTDKELMAEMMSAGPEMMKEMPAIIEKLKKATAHLPEPPKDDEEEEGTKPTA